MNHALKDGIVAGTFALHQMRGGRVVCNERVQVHGTVEARLPLLLLDLETRFRIRDAMVNNHSPAGVVSPLLCSRCPWDPATFNHPNSAAAYHVYQIAVATVEACGPTAEQVHERLERTRSTLDKIADGVA